MNSGGASSMVRLLGNGRLFATNAVGFCVLFSQVAMFTYVTFHLEAPPYGLSTAALGYLFVVYLFGAAVTPLAGTWVDRYGHRIGLAVGMGVGAVGALLTLASPLSSIVIGLALVGSGVFIAQATASSYIGVVTKADRGLAVGLDSTVYYLGGTLGGLLPSLFWGVGRPDCVRAPGDGRADDDARNRVGVLAPECRAVVVLCRLRAMQS
ncbi:MAG: MFS transporter [Vicinamibacterales bacterium]